MRVSVAVFCAFAGLGLQGTGAEEYKTKSGPFQVSLLSLHRQRDLMLVPGPWVWVDDEGRQRPIEKRTPRTRSTSGPLFQARLRVATEPRTFFRIAGPPAIVEAVDDLDQSLEAAPEEGPDSGRGMSPRTAFATADLRIPLSLPDQPGKTIRRLKGTIAAVISARSREPLEVVALSDAKGKSITAGGINVNILDVRLNPDRSAIVRLSATLVGEKANPRSREDQARLASRLADIAEQQLEIVDDQTRPVLVRPSTAIRRLEIFMTYRVAPGEQYGAVDRLRVFGLTRNPVEIPFDFKDIPMP